jgi:hypothetical protein
MKGFRVVNNFDEVVRALALSRADNFTFLLWQNIDSKRIQTSCRLLSFSQTSIIKVELEVPSDFIADKDNEFFIFQDDLNFLFKGSFSINRKGTLTLVLEQKLYLKENRESQRFTFENMSFDIVIDYIDTSSKKKKSFKAELVNISDSGMSFSIPASSSTKLFEGMSISLRSIESITFEKPMAKTC